LQQAATSHDGRGQIIISVGIFVHVVLLVKMAPALDLDFDPGKDETVQAEQAAEKMTRSVILSEAKNLSSIQV
jgi:hypothetical protein